MKILHYSLGIPPYRTGGLTKYCTDLMLEQKKQGNEVCLLYPGKIKIFSKKEKIIRNKNYNGINVYELINPLPVPLLNGIKDVEWYTEKKDYKVYESFLDLVSPDVIHIHTLMGVPEEFFLVAKSKKIKIVFTSHDYFGICPKVSLFNKNNENCDRSLNDECAICCKYALDKKKVLILQSHIYKFFKDSKIIKNIRKETKNNIEAKCKLGETRIEDSRQDYSKLFNYYKKIFNMIDKFHFNSEISYGVYKKFINLNNYEIIPITHAQIRDNRLKNSHKKIFEEKIQFAYLGAQTHEKGYYNLVKVFGKLEEKYENFNLNIFFNPIKQEKYVKINDPYKFEEMDSVYNKIDIVIVPSLWKETFGFVVLEALSYGIPVILSKNVGALNLVENEKTGYIYENEEELKLRIEDILNDRNIIHKMKENILKNKYVFDIKEHAKIINDFYERKNNNA